MLGRRTVCHPHRGAGSLWSDYDQSECLRRPGHSNRSQHVRATRRRLERLVAKAEGTEGKRGPWDFGRFLKTVTYFNKPPSPGQVLSAIVQQPLKLFGATAGWSTEEGSDTIIQVSGSPPSMAGAPVILVTGATGGTGKRIVATLLQQGKRVRALARDPDKARKLLGDLPIGQGGALELVVADITQPATLLPEMFSGVNAAVLATAVKVVPKEGDGVQRDKYMQGIKFYDPEIVGDTPEAVESRGISNVVTAVRDQLGLRSGKLLFAGNGSGAAKEWGALDDVVMGGRSESGFEIRSGAGENGAAAGVFSGLVTEENNGGFASVRTRNLDPPPCLTAYEGISLRIKGDGQRYKCVLRTDANWDGIGWTKSFDTSKGEWQTIQLPLIEFTPVFRAKTVKNSPPIDVSALNSIQLMLSKFEYDGQLNPSFKAGPFSLPVEEVRAYTSDTQNVRIIHISSAGVTRPNRPGIDLDAEPPAVKMNDQLGKILTYKLEGEDVVRNSGVPFAVVRPCALTEEDAGAEVELDQGDTIKGKIARQDIAELCAALLESSAATDTTFEVKTTQPFSQPFVAEPGAKPRDWKAILEGAKLKQNVTGKTIDGKYTGRNPHPQSAATKQSQLSR